MQDSREYNVECAVTQVPLCKILHNNRRSSRHLRSLMNISIETNMEREFSALKKVPEVKSDCKAGPTRLTAVNGRSKALSGMYCQIILTVTQFPQYLSGDQINMTVK